MADYVVNVNDPTTPTLTQGARQGAEEIRALKTALLSVSVVASSSASVRQAIQSASVDSSGYNNAITVGAGLRPGLSATDIPYQISHAAGFTGGKAINVDESIVADIADILGADLPLNNTSFIYRTAGVGFASTLIDRQERYAFDRSKQALLNFEAADGSVAMIDDFGNTWTASGNAQIDTAQFKFGASSLLLDGTGDFITSTNITLLGDGSWEISGWFRANSVAGISCVWAAENAANFGATLLLDNNAGSPRIRQLLSSDATSNNIAGAALGTTVIVVNTWYKVRQVFDALSGTYRVYMSNNGAAEVQELTVTSALKICAVIKMQLGRCGAGGTIDFNGWIDSFRLLPCATKTAIETPAAVAPTVTDYKIKFFAIPHMRMYEVTAPSVIAGVNPTLTEGPAIFVAEADTSGVAVTAIRNYAIRGEYISANITPLPAVNTAISLNHNLGTIPRETDIYLRCLTNNAGHLVGDVTIPYTQTNGAPAFSKLEFRNTKNTMKVQTGVIVAFVLTNPDTGAGAGCNVNSWVYFAIAKRGW